MPITIPVKVNPLVLSYPDFTLNSVINPDEFDQNNLDLQDKVNQTTVTINATIDAVELISNTSDTALSNSNTATSIANGAVSTANSALAQVPIVANQLFLNHISSNDHDGRYYSKETTDVKYIHRSEVGTNANVSVKYEVFTIVNPDLGNNKFSYTDELGTIIIGDRVGVYQVFNLQKGDYTLGEGRISAIINDTLHRSVASGGAIEVSSTKFGVAPELSGAEITIVYFSITGAMGSSIVIGSTTPLNTYFGKLWVDTTGGA